MSGIDWAKIHLLEARLAYHLGKYHYYQQRWEVHKHAGDWWHTRHDQHVKEHNKHAAEVSWGKILEERAAIAKWAKLMEPELAEVVKYRTALAKLKPKTQEWPMGGLVRPGTPYRWQRSDQGQDFEIPIYHSVVAPGHGVCLEYAADRPFPNGFGNPYAIVKFHDGPFSVWPAAYLGHANEPIIRPGQSCVPGQPLARLNHSLNSGWGWIEFGRWDGGPGGMNEGEKWRYLFKSVYR